MKSTLLAALAVACLGVAAAVAPASPHGATVEAAPAAAPGSPAVTDAVPPVASPETPPVAPGQPDDPAPVSSTSPAACQHDPANPTVYASAPVPPVGFCSWLDYASMPHDTTNPPAPYTTWQQLMDRPPILSFVPSGAPFDMNDPSTYPGA